MTIWGLFNDGADSAQTVVAGSPHEPMTRAIAADLERRGYIVYVTVSSADEEQAVQSESRADIKALWLDLTAVRSSVSLREDFTLTGSCRPPRRRRIFTLRCLGSKLRSPSLSIPIRECLHTIAS